MSRLRRQAVAFATARPTEPSPADRLVQEGFFAHQQGHVEAACEKYAAAIQADPQHNDALRLCGTAALQLGRPAQAVELLQAALAADPRDLPAMTNLASAFMALGRPEAAHKACEAALTIAPDDYDALYNDGNALLELGSYARAAGRYREALVKRPDAASAQMNLGFALLKLGLYAEALAALDRATDLAPASPKANYARGVALSALHRKSEAAAALERAVEADPCHVRARVALADVLRNESRVSEARAHLVEALTLAPDDAEAHNGMGDVLLSLGDAPAATAAFERAARSDPGTPGYGSNVVFSMHFDERVSAQDIRVEAERWARRHASGTPSRSRPSGPIRRVGFLSPDLHFHPVGLFLAPLLGRLEGFETVLFSNESVVDHVTERLQRDAGGWWDVSCLEPAEVADLVREEGIDVLIDLAGHTSRTRLDVCALAPAPLLLSWLGYSGTTGMGQFDGLIADRHLIPPGHEDGYTEPVLRLPDSFVCYEPPVRGPDVAVTPAVRNGFVTFGCVNSTNKVSDAALRSWAEILRRVPDARLVLGHHALGDPAVRAAVLGRLGAFGADLDRVSTRGALPREEYLASFAEIDVALDTLPYTGATTTCDTLWTGTPVLTLAGDRYSARMSASLLATVGRLDLVAHSLDEYVDRAVSLAADVPRLDAARRALRGQLSTSPLCDADRFARGFQSLLEEAWAGRFATAA